MFLVFLSFFLFGEINVGRALCTNRWLRGVASGRLFSWPITFGPPSQINFAASPVSNHAAFARGSAIATHDASLECLRGPF